jgi:hypothetical protein
MVFIEEDYQFFGVVFAEGIISVELVRPHGAAITYAFLECHAEPIEDLQLGGDAVLDITNMGRGKIFARRSAPGQKQRDEQCGKEGNQTLHAKPPWIGIEYYFSNLYKSEIEASCPEGERADL